jgi:hypothetical protein
LFYPENSHGAYRRSLNSVFSIQKGTEFLFDELGDWVITFLLPDEERFKFFRDDAVEQALLRMVRLQTNYHQARSAGTYERLARRL